MRGMPREIRTERLVLRHLEERDREPLLRMARDSRVNATYMIPDLSDEARADAFFARLRALCAAEEHFLYGIALDGALVGVINDCGHEGVEIELGYFIDPAHRGRGYAAEALRAVLAAAGRAGFTRAVCGYFEENPASRRVMEKCGLRPAGREDAVDYRGRIHRCLYMAVDLPAEEPAAAP